MSYEDYWDIAENQTVPVLARWDNGWILIGIDDSRTRTKCCWVNGGYGYFNVPENEIPLIDYLPDRFTCDLPYDWPR